VSNESHEMFGDEDDAVPQKRLVASDRSYFAFCVLLE